MTGLCRSAKDQGTGESVRLIETHEIYSYDKCDCLLVWFHLVLDVHAKGIHGQELNIGTVVRSRCRPRNHAGTTKRRAALTTRRMMEKGTIPTSNKVHTSLISKFFPQSSDCSFISNDAPILTSIQPSFTSTISFNSVVPIPIAQAVQNNLEPPLLFLNLSEYVNDVFYQVSLEIVRVYMYKKLVLEIFQQETATNPYCEFSQIFENGVSALSPATVT